MEIRKDRNAAKNEPQKSKELEMADGRVPRFGHRHIQVILLFVVSTIGFATRFSINVAIVAMTDNTTSSNPDIATFNWTNTNVILSAFYWGYICLQVVGARIVQIHGVKWFMLGGMLINTTAFVLIPPIAIYCDSSIGVMVCRAIQGLAQCLLLPNIHTALGKWAPVNERAKLSMIALSGVIAGNIIGEFVTGVIAASWAGWPATFYVFGGLSLASCVLWTLFAYNSPAVHPSITWQEKEYIESSLQVHGLKINKSSAPPWRAIFTSIPFWALFISGIGANWCNQTLLIETPTYLSKVMGFDITSNGFISAGPNILAWFAGFMYAFMADHLIEKKYLTPTNTRKAFQLLATIPPVICVAILGFLHNGQEVPCVVLLFVFTLFQCAAGCGQVLNHLDLSPNYCGILLATTNSVTAAIAICAPLYVQVVVKDMTSSIQWRQIYLTGASASLFGGLIFLLFGSAERQWWDSHKQADEIDLRKLEKLRDRKLSSISAAYDSQII